MTTYSQAKYWILTIPHANFAPYLPSQAAFIKGQLELGDGGFLHWQVMVILKTKTRLRGVRDIFGPYHAEPTKSDAAEAYVWKEDTAVAGTQFVLGSKPVVRGSARDWEAIKDAAKRGRLDDVPADIFVRNYNSLKRICTDNLAPIAVERTIHVFWGPTGTGKSRRAWDEASLEAYPKDPRSKFWDGYRGQKHVVIDEFRGGIDIAHLLRWFDRYPVSVEVKGSSTVLAAETMWITSNLHPRFWFVGLDDATYQALERRLTIVEFQEQ